MKIVFNIGKKEMFWILLIAILLSSFGYVIAQSAFNPGKAWHPLQKIAISESNLVSVDADNDNIIDNAEKVSQACRLCQKTAAVTNACGNGYSVVQKSIFNDQSATNDLGIRGYPSGCNGNMIQPQAGEFWLCCKG